MINVSIMFLPIGLGNTLSPILVFSYVKKLKNSSMMYIVQELYHVSKTLWDAEHGANSSSTTWPGGKMSAFLFGSSLVPVVAAVGWAKF